MTRLITPQLSKHHTARGRMGSLVACIALSMLAVPASTKAETDISKSFVSLCSVTDSELEQLRGGFRSSRGLEIRFGIRRVTLINGHTGYDRSREAHESISTGGDINLQNGITSSTLVDASRQLSLIQNSLDNQQIQSISIVDLRISNLFTLHSRLSTSRWIAESVRDL